MAMQVRGKRLFEEGGPNLPGGILRMGPKGTPSINSENMIQFFRRIRQKLLGGNRPYQDRREGRASRYALYAMGEILLVVIGILIALYINNINEYRKEREQEQVLLKQLRSEFNSNLQQLDQKIALRNEMMEAAKQFFELIDHPNRRDKDSIDLLIAKTLPYTTFDPIENDLASSGELMLIKNIELKQSLTRWSSNIRDVMEEEEIWKYYRNELYMPFLIQHYQFRTLRNKAFKSNVLGQFSIDQDKGTFLYADDDIGSSRHKEDFNALLDHPDLEDHLSRCYSINQWANMQSLILRKRIVEILSLVEGEISSE